MTSILLRDTGISADTPPPLTREQSHHIANVLRLKQGTRFRVLDGAGASRVAELVSVSKRETRYEYRGGVETLPRAGVEITLFQCVAKAARMDWLVEKATELGVARIVPVLSERTIAGANTDRWNRIAEAALCQCGGGWLPEIPSALKWDTTLAAIRSFITSGGTAYIGSLTPDSPSFSSSFSPHPSAFLIGPEGDFTPAEYESAIHAGAIPVSFGPHVLRVETAAIYAVSATLALASAGTTHPAGPI